MVDVLLADPDYSTLLTAIQTVDSAGVVTPTLVDTLSTPGPFTVFAPDNAAFDALAPGVLSSLLADPPALADILLYHVAPTTITAADVIAGGKEPTVLGPKVQFSFDGTNAFINSSQVLVADTFAGNGVVHKIDEVLLPSDAPATIIDVLDINPGFAVLRQAIEIAGLTATLDGPGPFTLLAPPSGAFSKLDPAALNALLNDPVALADLLTYHVIPGSFLEADVVGLDRAPTVQGNEIFVNATPKTTFLDQAKLLATDVVADNGVLHMISAVLNPAPTTLVDFVVENPSFETLQTAVVTAGLAGTLSGPGPFTLFAPTNRAFDRLPAGLLGSLLQDPAGLGDVLLYHVVPGKLFAADVLQLSSAATVLGPPVSISQVGTDAFINQSKLLATDIELANGVLHILDNVLIPPGP